MNYNVLIVDDSEITREILKKILRLSCIELGNLYEAKNGFDGIRQLHNNRDINLILLDINMPDMNGIEMAKQIKGNLELPKTQIILISSMSTNYYLKEAYNIGITAFIKKPFEPIEVKRVIDNLCLEFGKDRLNV